MRTLEYLARMFEGDDFRKEDDDRVREIADRLDLDDRLFLLRFVRQRSAWYTGLLNQLMHCVVIGFHFTGLFCSLWALAFGEMPWRAMAVMVVLLGYWAFERVQGGTDSKAWDIGFVAIGGLTFVSAYQAVAGSWPIVTVDIDQRAGLIGWAAMTVALVFYLRSRR